MGCKQILIKILKFLIYKFLFTINNNTKNAINLSHYMNNTPDQFLNIRFFKRKFKLTVSTQTLLALNSLEKNKDYIQKVYDFSNSPNVIFDIGANIGYWSLSFFEINKKGIDKINCFEPNRNTFKILNYNLNEINKIIINNFGLSEKNEIAKLSFPDNEEHRIHNLGLYSLYAKSNINFQEVKLKKFDDLYQVNVKSNYFFKIDVEGAEHRVLEGATNFLSSNCHITILIELNSSIDRYSPDNVKKSIKILNHLNYDCYYFENNKFVKLAKEKLNNHIKLNNSFDYLFRNF